ncbi:MAG: ATP-binding protein [Lachnospiraceae bacterium]|nr:ATP-binding protein [Lachnospiraceae bacterium]
MNKNNNHKIKIGYWLGGFLALLLLAGMTFVGWTVWKQYSTAILNLQKDQMLNTVDSVANNLEHELLNYQNDTNSLYTLAVNAYKQGNIDDSSYILTQYLSNKSDTVKALAIWDEQNNLLAGQNTLVYTAEYGQYTMENQTTLTIKKDRQDDLYFVFEEKGDDDTTLELAVSVRTYYEKLISELHIGSNGYLVVKSSTGTILMHPEEEQWGIDVIEGRETLYGIEELQSLKDMISEQLKGETGVSEYESYWWGNDALPRVRKISAYTPAYVGNDFLVVSAVIDYDDIFNPMFRGFVGIGAVFLGIAVVLIVFLFVVEYLFIQKRKSQEEILYLKDLNEVLEKTRQSEEIITHQQRLQIMGTMTGGIAHEFNNMLTPVMGYSELLLDMVPPDSEEYDCVKEIFDASERAKDVIQQISSLSRKNMETVFSFIYVKRLLNRTIKMARTVCPVNTQITVDESFEKEGFLGNETQMKQVFLNLCVNAFHAIGNGKQGTLDIHGNVESRNQIENLHNIQMDHEWDNYVCIRITDNGCGMSPETVEQIFTPFFTTKKIGQGTGLGLSVAEQIIHNHKGYICVKSQLGEGSSFYIYLPLTEERSINQVSLKSDDDSSDELIQILAVDDNGKVLKLLQKEFARLKINVQTVTTPEKARAILQKDTFQLILIDQTLAENQSGINFAMSIRNQYPEMIRILMVDQVKKEIIEALQQKLIDAYVNKPVSGVTIIEKVREINKEELS